MTGNRRGVTLIEMLVATAIFSLLVAAIFQVVTTSQKAMRNDAARASAEDAATRIIDRLGKDVRESSYAYIYAGDWVALRGGGAVTISVARNYFSATPYVGSTTLVPGIADEGWGQCPNPACTWNNHLESGVMEITTPHAFLGRPARNNPQVAPVSPPATFAFSAADARGRLFGDRAAGDTCPWCNAPLASEAFFGGMLLFSPRRSDRFFSYGGQTGYEVRWESMIFYCPFRDPNTGAYTLRRYVFHASALGGGPGVGPSLIDLLDFDANGVIESPPMTDGGGNFVLDADFERFSLVPSATFSGNALVYHRADATHALSFRIEVDRDSGQAVVSVGGGPFAGVYNVRCEVTRFSLGVSDFDVSTYINNPSWFAGGVMVNPTGVAEPGVVRVTFQVDQPTGRGPGPDPGFQEAVQVTMLRPRN